jgi:hypothetical protein
MKLAIQAENILAQINSGTKVGDLRTMAKDIRKEHGLAMELWSTDIFFAQAIGDLDYGSQASFSRFD